MNDVLNLAWNTQRVKTIQLVNGDRTQVEMSPKEILLNPNRHQVETIISSLCKSVSELISIQESQSRRILDLQNQIKKENDHAVQS